MPDTPTENPEVEARRLARPKGTLEGNPEGWCDYIVALEALLSKAEQRAGALQEVAERAPCDTYTYYPPGGTDIDREERHKDDCRRCAALRSDGEAE